jgi:acylphosphatase
MRWASPAGCATVPDGTLEVAAEGDRRALEELVWRLYSGPRHALVTAVETVWLPATGEAEGFAIR